MTLCFTRNKHVAVLPLGDDKFRVTNRLEDTYFTAEVEIEVTVPDLEVASARGSLSRSYYDECRGAASPRSAPAAKKGDFEGLFGAILAERTRAG